MVIAAMLRQSGEVEASAEVMADMNELVKAPELTKAVQKMAKQLQKVQTVQFVLHFLYRNSGNFFVLVLFSFIYFFCSFPSVVTSDINSGQRRDGESYLKRLNQFV